MNEYYGTKISRAEEDQIKTVLTSEVEERIREIVREELAAHKEQPVFLSVSHERLSALGVARPL